MASSRFTTLPTEVILCIFSHFEDFSVVAALIRTAPIFYQIWRLHGSLIAGVILPRVIDCFADAQELVVAQEAVRSLPSSTSSQEHEHSHDGQGKKGLLQHGNNGNEQTNSDISIDRAKCLLANHRDAAHDCELWLDEVMGAAHYGQWAPTRPARVNEAERTRFVRIYYHLWTYIVLFDTGNAALRERANAFLARKPLGQLYGIVELGAWVYSSRRCRIRRGKPPHDSWSRSFAAELDELWTPRLRGKKGIGALHRRQQPPPGFFAVFDLGNEFVQYLDRDVTPPSTRLMSQQPV